MVFYHSLNLHLMAVPARTSGVSVCMRVRVCVRESERESVRDIKEEGRQEMCLFFHFLCPSKSSCLQPYVLYALMENLRCVQVTLSPASGK